MMKLLRIALKSAYNRKTTLLLTVLSISISILLLLGVDKIRKEARNTFMNTISGTDLIVGARSGPINLLLYSVFRIGNATNNISWETYEKFADNSDVAWSIPISLGDSHKGFRVMGTTQSYFEHYRYASHTSLAFKEGESFKGVYEAVIGWQVAKRLGYTLGKKIILSHGLSSIASTEHKDKPFSIVGVLKPTGTPVDQTIHVTLAGIEALHIDYHGGRRMPFHISAQNALKHDLKPKSITAVMLGLTSRIKTFRMQRTINEYRDEPLLAIIPGATLASLWQALGNFEKVLVVISVFVIITALVGMLTMILSTLNERRREMAVLRAVGAHPYQIVLLFVLETLLIVSLASVLGVILLYALLFAVKPLILSWYGLYLNISFLDLSQWMLLGGTIISALIVSLIPGFIAYRHSLQDGLQVKI